MNILCVGNICLGKYGVLHCSQWAVQSINFLQQGMLKRKLKAAVLALGLGTCSDVSISEMLHTLNLPRLVLSVPLYKNYAEHEAV